MRTDCTIRTKGTMRLPNVSVGHIHKVARGDVVVFQESGEVIGRVIGFVKAKDLEGPRLLVAAVFNGVPYERWVKPEDVTQSFHGTYLQWLFTDAFLDTPVDVARDCSKYLVNKQLMESKEWQKK